jgi:hypothetical protein
MAAWMGRRSETFQIFPSFFCSPTGNGGKQTAEWNVDNLVNLCRTEWNAAVHCDPFRRIEFFLIFKIF